MGYLRYLRYLGNPGFFPCTYYGCKGTDEAESNESEHLGDDSENVKLMRDIINHHLYYKMLLYYIVRERPSLFVLLYVTYFSSFFSLRKKLSDAVSVRPSVRPSVVCGNNYGTRLHISTKPIDFKFGLNIGIGVMHV